MSTAINVDQLLDQLEPWDLVVTVGGQEHQTRQLTLGDLAVLLGALQAKPPRIDEFLTTLESLFHIDPGVREWPPEVAFKVGTQIADYFGNRSSKKTGPVLRGTRRPTPAQNNGAAPEAGTEDQGPTPPAASAS